MRQGGCRCGKVRFEATGAPMLTVACHCTGCQHMTASAFSLSDGYSTEAFRVTSGETALGGIHGGTRHHHCGYCKSWLYTQPEGLDTFVNVRSTMFDRPSAEPPFVEVFTGESLPWVNTGAAHSYEQLPEMEEWPTLMRDYARRAGATEDVNR